MSLQWTIMQNLKKNWLVVWKNDIRNLSNFHVISWKSENLHLEKVVLSKGYKVSDEKVQMSYVSWHWKVKQSLKKKLTLGSKNLVRNSVNLNGAVASIKIWCATFVESILFLNQKNTEELCVITLKNDVKYEKELTWALKNDRRNLENFDSTLESFKISTLMGYFPAKNIMLEPKN